MRNKSILLFICLLFAGPILAQVYESGHQALQVWDARAMTNMPLEVKVWLYFMLLTFVIGLAFVRTRVEARWVVCGVLLGLAVTKWVLPAMGFTMLSGLVALVHVIFWTPALYQLLRRRTFLRERSFYALWCAWVALVILISFVFDIRDSVIYLEHVL